MASEGNRSRYWSRSFAGWGNFSSTTPNAAHDAIARLQSSGECEGPVVGLESIHCRDMLRHPSWMLYPTTHSLALFSSCAPSPPARLPALQAGCRG